MIESASSRQGLAAEVVRIQPTHATHHTQFELPMIKSMDNEVQPDQMRCMEVWGGNRAVQRSFDVAGLKIWAFSQPYGEAQGGGDVYYLSSCASGRITRMLLADVSGHGEQVSSIARSLRDLIRRNINVIKQTRFVSAMNRQFAAVSEDCNFATALVTTFFAPTKTLSLCNAGHPPPLIYRQRDNCWSELSGEKEVGREIADTPLGLSTKRSIINTTPSWSQAIWS